MGRLLKPGGVLNLQVPALPILYGTLDKALGHYRRYTTRSLSQVLENNHFRIRKLFYMNVPGLFGWFMTGRVLKRNLLSTSMLTVFDRLVPLFRTVEKIARPPIAQCLVAIAERTAK